MTTMDLLAFGRVGVDLYAQQIHAPLSEADSFKKYVGGSPANVVIGLSRLGMRAGLISAVGADAMGEYILSTLQTEGVDTTCVQRFNKHLTALVLLGVQPPNQFPLMFYRENCADMQVSAADICGFESQVKQAKNILLSGTSLSSENMLLATEQLIALAKKHQVNIIFDLDYRPVLWGLTDAGNGAQRFIFDEAVSARYQSILAQLPENALLVGTDEECAIAAGHQEAADYVRSVQTIQARHDCLIVVKAGAKGSCFFANKSQTPHSLHEKTQLVETLNTLGAGDAYLAGFLSVYLRGLDKRLALRTGNICGAIVAARHGCAPAMPSQAEVDYFIDNYAVHQQKVVMQPELSRMHQQTCLCKAHQRPTAYLAFDHRSQFSADPQTIMRFKALVYQAFKQAKKYYQGDMRLGMICDPIYGLDVLKQATQDNQCIATPIEAAGLFPTQFIEANTAVMKILQSRPAHWVTKFLWPFHPDMMPEHVEIQQQALKTLAQACDASERQLMLELIIPPGFALTGETVAEIIRDVYREKIYPACWKLQMHQQDSDWDVIVAAISEFDPAADVIVLGGGQLFSDDLLQQQLQCAAKQSAINGFAFGRALFMEAWDHFMNKTWNNNQVVNAIAGNYLQAIALWETTRKTTHEQGSVSDKPITV